ncbi:MAG: poly-gamma-glutamate system protein [Candidatus Brocadiae bacterium]|nr:poly-gamma-glutamate system protein [Candidatus Brocadiia bacterium]
MILRKGKVPRPTLVVLACLAASGYFMVEHFQVEVREPWYEAKRAAVKDAGRGQEVIRAARARAGLSLNYDADPQQTGLIGADDQGGALTTDRGFLKAKQAATHPNLAAVLVGMLKEAGVGEGDPVAVGMTGSFPGANLATICAIEEIRAKPIVITSIGSSTFGANEAELTWLDMEKALFDAGVIRTRSLAASIGGDKDKGVGLNKAVIALMEEAAKRNGVPLIREKTLVQSIDRRMALFAEAAGDRKIRCYVNIGGGLASVGSSVIGNSLIDTGLTKSFVERNYPTEGVMLKMLRSGKPVIHLLDFRKLADDHGLAMEDGLHRGVGEGPVFHSVRYNLWLVVGTLVTLLVATILAVRLDLRQALFEDRAPSPSVPPPAPGA